MIMLVTDAVSAEKPACLFENPYRLVSLWDMAEVFASRIANISTKLLDLQIGFPMRDDFSVTQSEITETIELLTEFCADAQWPDLANQARRLLGHYAAELHREHPEAMSALAGDLHSAFTEKARRVKLVIIAEQDTGCYLNAVMKFCGTDALHPDLAISEEELNLAGRAYAVGLTTASVMHAMRAVEASLHALCKRLSVTYPGGVEQQDWKVLVEKIVAETKKVDLQKRSAEKAEALERLARLMLAADGFKNAWRNHVAHARQKYESTEADKVLRYVGDFFRDLSMDLGKIP
jgi:HEPN domain-containing protein